MKILFRKLRYQNFLASGNNPIEIELDKEPITLFVGTNGAGKSTCIDAICYALFNEPFRDDVRIPQLINSVNAKKCLVELEFTIGKNEYRIVRGQKPTKFEIYKNDELIPKPKKSLDYQSIIENEIICMDKKTFKQIVILGSDYKPFMKLPTPDRRIIVEDLIDVIIIGQMNALLGDKMKITKRELSDIDSDITMLEQKKVMLQRLVDQANENVEKELKDIDDQIEEITDETEDAEKDVESIQKKIEDLGDVRDPESVRKKIVKLKETRAEISVNKKSIEKDVTFFTENDNCPTCQQEIDELFKNEILNKRQTKLGQIEKGLLKLDKDLDTLSDELEVIQTENGKISNFQREISSLQNTISSNMTRIDRLKGKRNEVENRAKEEVDTSELDDVEKELDDKLEEKDRLSKEFGVQETSKKILKDDAAKAQIIKKYIPIMNQTINHYLGKMGLNLMIEIDENFNETFKARHRDTFSYGLFSAGQKMRIDLAFLLCWIDIAKRRNSVNTNLLILDEVFDASLDQAGIDEFLRILKYDLGGDKNTIVISPKGELLYDNFDNVFKFSLDKGFTKMVQGEK